MGMQEVKIMAKVNWINGSIKPPETPEEAQEHAKGAYSCLDKIEGFSAAGVQPVRHGRWEWMGPCRDGRGKLWATYSECGIRQRLGDYSNNCPCCGAKMDGGEDNG